MLTKHPAQLLRGQSEGLWPGFTAIVGHITIRLTCSAFVPNLLMAHDQKAFILFPYCILILCSFFFLNQTAISVKVRKILNVYWFANITSELGRFFYIEDENNNNMDNH